MEHKDASERSDRFPHKTLSSCVALALKLVERVSRKGGDVATVLAAMGYTPAQAGRVLRFSSGWETTVEDWAALAEALGQVHRELQAALGNGLFGLRRFFHVNQFMFGVVHRGELIVVLVVAG